MKKQPMIKKKKRLWLLVLELLLLFILIPIAFSFYHLGRMESLSIAENEIEQNDFTDPNMDDYINIALFGVDSRDNELTSNTRSDCVMIASINKKTNQIKLVSLYRDTYVYIKDHGYTKLTHAYAYGGPKLAINTINKNFDLNVKDFVTINFSALTNVIDALGGVELKITKEELPLVNAYARDVAKINHTTVQKLKKPGRQTLTGVQATGYCRVRYTSGGDFTRAARQRAVLEQIIQKLKHSNPITLGRIINDIMPQIYTSLPIPVITKLGIKAFSYDVVESIGFPFEKSTPTINKASVVTAETLASNVTQLHLKLFDTSDYTPSSTVEYRSNEIQTQY